MTDDGVEMLTRWRDSPAAFVRECLDAEPDAWQLDVLDAFNGNRRMAMKAAKGVGKSTVLAWLIWYFMVTRSNPKVACTSVTGDNLRDGLWTELAFWQGKSELLKTAFEWSQTRLTYKRMPETWWASARQWSQSADQTKQADTLAGLHADNLLFVIDEAGGVPDGVVAAAEAGLATIGGDKHLIIAGNPTLLSGPLYRAATTERHLWHVTEISSDPDDAKRSPRVSIEWAKEQIDKYGRDNPWVLVNVFGRFPPASMNTLISPDECSAAIKRECPITAYQDSAHVIGIDVARFGDDRTVIVARQGVFLGQPVILRAARTEEICGHIARMCARAKPDGIFIDGSGGYGAGVADMLRRAGYPVLEVQGAGKPMDMRYYNKRAECWFELTQWVKERGTIPNIPELVRELCSPTYFLHKDKLQIEDKEQIKKRLGSSPDIADAAAYTFAFPVQPKKDYGLIGQAQVARDYDPMADYLQELNQ